MHPILILKRDNVFTILWDWTYPLPPSTVYYNRNLLKIETYDFSHDDKDGKIAYYNYVLEQDN